MMDHALRTISYIADIGNIVVLMARRRVPRVASQDCIESTPGSQEAKKQYKMVCHVFESEDAQLIAQSIGQAFSVAYQEFLRANGINPEDLSQKEYSDIINTQEMYNDDLVHFSNSANCKEGLKNQVQVKLNIVSCPPVTTVLIKRPDLKYQLGKSTFNMWELFKDLLIRVQDQHAPVRRKDNDGKVSDLWIMRMVVNLVKREKEAYEKDMEDSEVSVEYANMLGHFEIEKEVVLGLFKSIKVDKSPGPNGIYPRFLRETRGEIAGALTKIFVSSLATGEVLEDWHEVTKVISKGSAVAVAYMDFSQAFNKVPHGILIQKIKMYGIH
eukprot:g44648.t1